MLTQGDWSNMKFTLRIWILLIVLSLAALMISPNFQTGVVIKSVEKNSTAVEQGLKAGMKILELNDEKIKTIQDYYAAVPVFQGENLSRIKILTDKGTFIFLDKDLSSIVV